MFTGICCYPQAHSADSGSPLIFHSKAVVKKNTQKILVHYMPWFEDTLTSGNGKWGQHWTMANRDPGKFLEDGRREIASHFYPLIGPYASADPDVLDYHLLLMKYAGIDGVIADWYGIHNNYDYGLIKGNTDALFKKVKETGLQLAICYEDASLLKARSGKGVDILTAAREDFAYLQQYYFSSNNYFKINSQPLLLCFGPDVLERPWFWSKALASLPEKPCLLTLWYKGDHAGYMGMGEFPWIDAHHLNSLQQYYQNRQHRYIFSIAGAYPGFRDFYQQGGWGAGLFVINHDGTATFQKTLDMASASKSAIIQINTWNDFGEGTMIEPTREFNFRFLELIQQFTGVPYSKKELELVYRWYLLRKKYRYAPAIQQQLLSACHYLEALETAQAAKILSTIQ